MLRHQNTFLLLIKFFMKNPRMNMLVNIFNKMDKEKKQNHLSNAQEFLKHLYDRTVFS